METLLRRAPFAADQVKQVTVRVAADEATIVDNRTIPDICMQHLIAVMIVDRNVTFKSAHDVARMKDPAVLRQRAKVNLVHDEALERLMPKRVAVVEVALTDGKVLSERVEAVRGTADNPMTREEVAAKARELITPVLGVAATAKLIDRIFDLENLKNVRDLRPLLQKA